MNILEEAMQVVDGARQTNYGHPRDNHGTTAEMWTSYLHRRGLLPADVSLDAHDVCDMNILQKVSRDAHSRVRDNQVDIAGFARNTEMIEEGPPDEKDEQSYLWPLTDKNLMTIRSAIQLARMSTPAPLKMILFGRDFKSEDQMPRVICGLPVGVDSALDPDEFHLLTSRKVDGQTLPLSFAFHLERDT